MSLHSYSSLQALNEDTASDSSDKTKSSGSTRFSKQSSHQSGSRNCVLPDTTTASVGSGTCRRSKRWSNASCSGIPGPGILSSSSSVAKLRDLRCCDLRDTPKVIQLFAKVCGPLDWCQMKSISLTHSIRRSISSGLSFMMEDIYSDGKSYISGCILADRLSYQDFEVSTMMSPNYWFNAQMFAPEWQTMMGLINHHMLFLSRMIYVYKEALFITLPLIDPLIAGDLYEAYLLYTKMMSHVLFTGQVKGLKLGLFIANGNVQKNVARNVGFIPLSELPLPLGSWGPSHETFTLMALYPNNMNMQSSTLL